MEGAIIGTALYVGNFTLTEALELTASLEQGGSPPEEQRITPHEHGHARRHLPSQRARRTARDRPLLDGRLRDLLAGKKILMTGVTGFIGEQLLWKILTELPGHHAGRAGPPQALGRGPGPDDHAWSRRTIFPSVREAAGGPEELLDARIDVIEGDLPNVPVLPTDIDIVVHCAGDVSFDPPIDQAFTTNVIGTKALMDRMIEAVHRRRRQPAQGPALRAHLHRLHRRAAPGRDPGGARTCTPSTTRPRPGPDWRCGT